jgi:KDO2-lipid IV(A) lauroyltransferase
MKNIKSIVTRYLNLVIASPVYLVVAFLGHLPYPVSLKMGEFFGYLSFLLLRDRRRVTLFNLEIAKRGGLKIDNKPIDIARATFMNMGRSAAELCMLFWGRDEWLKKVEIVGAQNFRKARDKGRGVIFFTGHCGNWELSSLLQGWRGYPVSAVARPLRNDYINRIFETLRKKYNNKVIYKKGALKKILLALRNKETVGILIDQSASRHEAIVTEFFGEDVFTTRLPALIALKTNASVLPGFISRRDNGRHIATIGEEIPLVRTGDMEKDIVTNTKIFTAKVEAYIHANPTEWLWLHRRWKLRYGREY